MWFTGINYYKLAVEKDRDYFYDHIETRLYLSRPQNLLKYLQNNLHEVSWIEVSARGVMGRSLRAHFSLTRNFM